MVLPSLRVMCLFSVSDNRFEQGYLCMHISDILDKYDCICIQMLTIIISRYSRLSLLAFHKVSLQYIVNCFWIVNSRAYMRV